MTLSCRVIVMEQTVAYADFLVRMCGVEDLCVRDIQMVPFGSEYKVIKEVIGYFVLR